MARPDAGADGRAGAAGEGRFARLLGRLDPARPVLVQTHDYPDIDAVASAWALSELLARRGLATAAVYRGEIRSRSLARLVRELGIAIRGDAAVASAFPSPLDGACQLVAVDGSPSNGNVSLFPGELVGVVDHHFKSGAPSAPYLDIRPELASCSSMLYGYWEEADEAPGGDLATALLAGIQSDTDFLSRRSSAMDFRAYAALYGIGDWERASRIVRTALDLRELGLIGRALSSAEVRGGLLYASVSGPCGQEALAVLADFALRAEGLLAAVVAERDPSGVHFSVRSRSPSLSAFGLARRALAGIGTGGGHSHAAGGIVPAAASPADDAIRDRFFAAASLEVAASAGQADERSNALGKEDVADRTTS